MAEVQIALMGSGDLDAIMRVEQSSFSIPWLRESFEHEISENKCARYLVLREDGVAVAYAGVWFVLDEGHITNVAVLPEKRGLGYGEQILQALMQLASDSGMSWMTLECRRSNAAAQGLYRKLGFVDVGYRKGYYADNHEDALIMLCENLPPSNPENDPFIVYEL